MKTLILCSPKGGSGKTTISRNITVAAALDGVNVASIDLDPQGTLSNWWHRRPTDIVTDIPHYVFAIEESPTWLEEIGQHDLLVIDTPPSIYMWPEAVKALLLKSDHVLIPTQPTVDDMEPAVHWMDVVIQCGVTGEFVLNKCLRRGRSISEAKLYLSGYGPVCPIELTQREDVHRAAANGFGVLEIPKHPAAEEFQILWNHIRQRMRLPQVIVQDITGRDLAVNRSARVA